jgi:hypothetical protein
LHGLGFSLKFEEYEISFSKSVAIGFLH